MAKRKFTPVLENKGSLITYKDATGLRDHCLGDLWYAEGHGVYEPNLGRVDVTPEEAEIHNKCLSEAMIKGMDDQCKVGQGSYAYLYRNPDCVKTFNGMLISADVRVAGNSITFLRNGRKFHGCIQKDSDAFNFRRVS